MSPEAFKHTLSRDEFCKITVDDMSSAKHTLDICFGKDTNLRKELLLDTESTGILPSDLEEPTAEKKKAKAAALAKATKKASSEKKATNKFAASKVTKTTTKKAKGKK